MTAALASGGEAPLPYGAIVRLTDAHRPAARGGGRDDVGRTFGRLGDVDDTCHADQKRDSASRAAKPASARTPPQPPVRWGKCPAHTAEPAGEVRARLARRAWNA